MKVYRISTSDYSDDLSGTGARIYGGRWNKKGSPLLYCSENVSLSIFEILVHFDSLTIPQDLELLELQIDGNQIEVFPLPQFKKIKAAKDAEYQFKNAGQEWIKACTQLALKVPSIISIYDHNILINPSHPNFSQIVKTKKESLELDSRLFNVE